MLQGRDTNTWVGGGSRAGFRRREGRLTCSGRVKRDTMLDVLNVLRDRTSRDNSLHASSQHQLSLKGIEPAVCQC